MQGAPRGARTRISPEGARRTLQESCRAAPQGSGSRRLRQRRSFHRRLCSSSPAPPCRQGPLRPPGRSQILPPAGFPRCTDGSRHHRPGRAHCSGCPSRDPYTGAFRRSPGYTRRPSRPAPGPGALSRGLSTFLQGHCCPRFEPAENPSASSPGRGSSRERPPCGA